MGLRFAHSYTTLHDHQIGAEILKQTDIEKQFEASALRAKEYKPQLVRILASKFKSSNWWRANEASIVKVLEKNRKRLRILKDVHES